MLNKVLERFPFRTTTDIKNLHVYRQVAATFASCLLSIASGFTLGHTAVLLPKLEADRDFPYDKSYDSWIASVLPIAMMFGCLCSGSICDVIGRRKGQILLSVPFALGWIVVGLSKTNAILLTGRALTGLCAGAVRPVSIVYIGEISDPKIRSTTLLCPGVGLFIGALFCHLVGHYLPWRIVSFIFIIPCVLCFLIQLYLKESPLWLVAKGQTERGSEAFKWFRGDGDKAEAELKAILDSQENEPKSSWNQFVNFVFTMAFLKSLIAIFFVFVAVQLCGVNTVSFYAQEMFLETFGGAVDPFMLMILTDTLRVICTIVMCCLAKKLPMKLSFVVCCFGTSIVLVGLVIYLLLKPVGLLWVALTCLITYIAIAGAMASMSWSFVAEIFPSMVRGFGSGLSSLISFSLLFVSVKVTPSIMTNYGGAAMYGSFAIVTLIPAFLLIFILPNTNGKSLKDIENTMYKKNNEVILNYADASTINNRSGLKSASNLA